MLNLDILNAINQFNISQYNICDTNFDLQINILDIIKILNKLNNPKLVFEHVFKYSDLFLKDNFEDIDLYEIGNTNYDSNLSITNVLNIKDKILDQSPYNDSIIVSGNAPTIDVPFIDILYGGVPPNMLTFSAPSQSP